jgi:hypothetical protein
MVSPDDLELTHTLASATTRYDELRMRDALNARGDREPLTREEVLEMLALGEVLIRKAGYARQATVRAAREAGASWAQIGVALGSSKQAAWEAHNRWSEERRHPA